VDEIRRELLHAEWKSIGFHLFDCELDSQLVEETLFACYPRRHENKAAVYGVIVADTDVKPFLADLVDFEHPMALEEARELADGDYSFVSRNDEKVELITFPQSYRYEYGVFRIRDRFLKGIGIDETPSRRIGIVTRSAEGDIRVLGPRNIAIRHADTWSIKEYKYSYAMGINLSQKIADDMLVTMREAVSLCVHGLSARQVGGTVVVKRTEGAFEHIDVIGDTKPLQQTITIADPRWHLTLIQLLSQKDGAMLVRRNGEIELIGARLATTPENCCFHPGGMRHNSAKSYSACNPDCTVIVVSEAGPVTVFASGAAVPPWDPLRQRIDVELLECTNCCLEFEVELTDGEGDECCPRCGVSLSSFNVGNNRRLRIKV